MLILERTIGLVAIANLAACAGSLDLRSGDEPPPDSSPAGTPGETGGENGETPSTARVYASTQDELFELNPITKELRRVGSYSCIRLTSDPNDSQDGMADIAIDQYQRMYGIGRISDGGQWALVSIEPSTAACTVIAPVDVTTMFPCGLTFVPEGTLDPTSEVLVGINLAGEYVRFDTTTGARTPVGSLGSDFFSKGADIVSIKNGGTYTTGQSEPDTLYGLDPANGSAATPIGTTSANLIAGLGFWGGTLYAFSYTGRLYAVDATTASSTEIAIPNAPAGLRFWGAAVTTIAPVTLL
jgi:hypothetical protein